MIVKTPAPNLTEDPGLPKLPDIQIIEEETDHLEPDEVPLGTKILPEERKRALGLVMEYRDVFTPGITQQRTTLMHQMIDPGLPHLIAVPAEAVVH
jgi:hypothetical protein